MPGPTTKTEMRMPTIDPANPEATSEARALLSQIQQLGGRHTFSGLHNTPREMSLYSAQADELTGRYPAIWGQDFGFAEPGDMDGISFRQQVIDEAKKQFADGSIITFMWHAVRPTEEEPVTFEGSICNGMLAEDDWRDLLTEGTETHARWLRQADVIAGFLGQLRDASIPVLWRPYHEMNGNWFWWGGREGADGYAALYRQLYRRFVDVHQLHNLIWVWNTNAPRGDAAAYDGFYPGPDVVDILAADVYANDYRQSHHDQLLELADGRPIALGEVGIIPTPEILEAQSHWSWFMVWTNFLTRDNTPDEVRRLFASPRVLHRDA